MLVMNNKIKLDAITDMDVDFAVWYTDVVTKAGLASYSPVKGCMYLPPYGTALWENIKSELDKRLKETGHVNVTMPLLVPESMLQKEKDHIAGFAPEVAWVTYGGSEKLAERLCIRPTSEVLFCDYFSNNVQSYRDLPLLFNQWANIVRWERATRPFLRTTEFFWQEGHTLHETEKEARDEVASIHKLYADFARNVLAMPVIEGEKTAKERFAGAVETYTIEAMMHDGKALQAGTSHFLGQGFTKSFGIKFQGRTGKEEYPYQTSWGVSTRLIGGIIMTHGDNNGLVMPPFIAPIQAVVVPVASHREGVVEAAQRLLKSIDNVVRAHIDLSDNTPGWKFAQWEMKGVPIRIEYGPRDIEAGSCVIARRDTGEKLVVPVADLKKELPKILNTIHQSMYDKALRRRESMTHSAETLDQMVDLAKNKPGFIKAAWCESEACEDKLKEHAVTSRCIEKPDTISKCAICGKQSKHMVYWGKSY